MHLRQFSLVDLILAARLIGAFVHAYSGRRFRTNKPTNKMLDRSPRRSVSTFGDFVGGDSVIIVVIGHKHMSPFEAVSATQAYRERCEDRVAIFTHEARTVVVVADGAGGTGAGDVAALAVIREIEAEYMNIHSANEWAAFLRQIDCLIGDGETTAVVVDVRTIGIAGASVGDSRAVVVRDGTISELTANQKRKPLIGSGMAEPIGFVCPPLDGLLLLGTDGFFNYAKPNAILASIAKSDFQTLPRKCIDMVRLPSGDYWDDVGVVAVRHRPRSSTRRRFTVD